MAEQLLDREIETKAILEILKQKDLIYGQEIKILIT